MQLHPDLVSTLQKLGATDSDLSSLMDYFQNSYSSGFGQVEGFKNSIVNLQTQQEQAEKAFEVVSTMLKKFTVEND